MYFEKKKTQTHTKIKEKRFPIGWNGRGKKQKRKKNNGCFFKQESKLKIESLPIATDHKT